MTDDVVWLKARLYKHTNRCIVKDLVSYKGLQQLCA